jgi:murein DD-endopeptidase MepM/ murein hydrolase activator NlpD
MTRRLVSLLLIISHSVYILPAQEISIDYTRGRQRLERYLDRALQERSVQSWEAIASAGLEAAILEWESANIYLKEYDLDLWQTLREDALGIYSLEKERSYVKWAGMRLYDESARSEGSALAAALREAAYDFYYEREGGEAVRQIHPSEALKAKAAWEETASRIVDNFISSWESKSFFAYGELYDRFTSNGLGSEDLSLIYGLIAGERRERILEEYSRIALAEGSELLRVLLYDSMSLKKRVSEEAAGAVARRLSEEAKGATEKQIDRIFGELDVLISSDGQDGVSIGNSEWLASFRTVFDAGLARWDEAEYSFLASRAAWEREAELGYIESEEVWSQAYGKLEQERRAWEQAIIDKLEAGSLLWAEKQLALWSELETARHDYALILNERWDNKARLIEAQISIYDKSRDLLELAHEGISFWWEDFGTAYTWYESKYKELFGSQGPPDDGSGTSSELEVPWPSGYVEGYIKEALERPDLHILTGSGHYELLRQLNLWQEIYKYVWEEISAIELSKIENEIINLKNEIELLESGIYGTLMEGYHDDILEKRTLLDLLLAGLEYYNTGAGGRLLESGAVLTDSSKGWLTLALRYREEADKAVVQLYRLSGIDINHLGKSSYVDELGTELLKAQAVLSYWEDELYVASALESYARRYDSLLESEGKTFDELEKAKREYDISLNEYTSALNELQNQGVLIGDANAGFAKAEAELIRLNTALKEARQEYNAVLAILEGVSTEYLGSLIADTALHMKNNRLESQQWYTNYLSAAESYGQSLTVLSVSEEIHSIVQGNSDTWYSKAELDSKLSVFEKTAELSLILSNWESVLGVQFRFELDLRDMMGVLVSAYGKASGVEKDFIELSILSLWNTVEQYYRAHLLESQRAVLYLLGEADLYFLSEEESRALELRSWLTGQRAGIAQELKSAESARFMTLTRQLELLDSFLLIYDPLDFLAALQNKRSDLDLLEILQDRVIFSVASYGVAWSEYLSARVLNNLEMSEGNLRIQNAYVNKSITGLSITVKESWSNIAVIQKEFDSAHKLNSGYAGLNIDILSDYIKRLRSAGSGLDTAGGIILEEYIQGLLEYLAIQDVRRGIDIDTSYFDDFYETSVMRYEALSGWYTTLNSAGIFFSGVLAGGEFDTLALEAQAQLLSYGAKLLLLELSVSDISSIIAVGADGGDSLLRLAQGRLPSSWALAYVQLSTPKQEALYANLIETYSGGVEYSDTILEYVYWYKSMLLASSPNEKARIMEAAQERSEALASWYAAEDFLGDYARYRDLLSFGNLSAADSAEKAALEELFEGHLYRGMFMRAANDLNYETNSTKEWYSYYLASAELLYVYLSAPHGFGYIPEAVLYLKEAGRLDLASRLESYYRIESAAGIYHPLLDGSVMSWTAGLDNLNEEEKQKLYQYLVYGDYISGLEYYRDIERLLRSFGGDVICSMLAIEQVQIYELLHGINLESYMDIHSAEAGMQYALYVHREQETEYSWVEPLLEICDELQRELKYNLSEEQLGAVSTIKLTINEYLLASAWDKIEYLSVSINDYIESGGFYVNEIPQAHEDSLKASERLRETLFSAMEKYQGSLWMRPYVYDQMSQHIKQYKISHLERSELEKRKIALYEEIMSTREAYTAYQQGEYTLKVQEIQEAYANYNHAAERLNASHSKLNASRLELRARQEICDWAESMYLRNFGENTAFGYETPKEKLGRVQYAYERAAMSVRVLQELTAGIPFEDAEYSSAMEEYRETTRRYYFGLAAEYEADRAIAVQREIVARAVWEEQALRYQLVISPDKNEPPAVSSHVTLSYNETGTRTTVILKDPSESDEYEKPVYEEMYLKYFSDPVIVQQGVQDADLITLAEKETMDWLLQLNEKIRSNPEYYNDLMLAAVYHGKMNLGNFSLGGIVTPHPDTTDFNSIYRDTRNEQLLAAYRRITRTEGGEEDLANYLLYRNTTLVHSGENYEKTVLAARSLGNVVNSASERRSHYERLELLFYGLGIFLAPPLIALGIYYRGVKNRYTALVSTVRKIRDGEMANKQARDDKLLEALATWSVKYEVVQREQEKLNLMIYGGADYPGSGDGVVPQLSYSSFTSGVNVIYGMGLQSVSASEAKDFYTESLFKASGAAEKNNVLDAITAINSYLGDNYKEAARSVQKRSIELQVQQTAAQAEYEKYAASEKDIKESDRKALKELAWLASDITRSVSEREEASKAYDALFSSIISAQGIEEELRRLAQAAWGKGSWNSSAHDTAQIDLASGLFHSLIRYERGTETYTAWSAEMLKTSILTAAAKQSSLEMELEDLRLNLIAADFIRQRSAWEEQVKQVIAGGMQEWSKAQGRFNNDYNNWKRSFQNEYNAKTSQWEENYLRFVLEKQEWVETQYVHAVNVGNAGLLEQSGADVGAVISRALSGTLVERMSRSELDVDEYIKMLLEGTNLSKLMDYAGSLTDRSRYAASAVHKGNSRESVTSSLVAAKNAQEAMNEELRENAARLAASQARKLITDAIASYERRLNAENEGMWEMQQEMVRSEGYTIDSDGISRIGVTDMTFWDAVTQRQSVHKYEYFSTSAPVVRVNLDALDGLSPDTIMHLVNMSYRDLELWGENIFGRTEDNGYGGLRTVIHLVDRTSGSKFHSQQANLLYMELSGDGYSTSGTYSSGSQGQQLYYEKLNLGLRESSDTPRHIAELRDGKLGEHIGYGPAFRKDLDIKAGAQQNIQYHGSGQMGLILLDLQWNSIVTGAGWAEAAKPAYDLKLWSGDGFIEPLTIRTLSALGAQIVGNIVGTVVGGIASIYLTPAVGAMIRSGIIWGSGVSNDLLFAALDTAFTDRNNADIWAEFGKNTAISAASSFGSFGMGQAAGAVGGAIAKGVITAAGTYTTTVATSHIAALDFRTGRMDWNAANRSWYSANTIGGALSAGIATGVTAGLTSLNTGKTVTVGSGPMATTMGEKLVGFNPLNMRDIGNLNSLIGDLAGQGVNFAFGGDFTLNVLNLGMFTGGRYNAGLLELHLGRDGASMNFGLGGANVSADNIASAMRGAQVWNVNNRINSYVNNVNNTFGSAIALRSQYGFGDSVQQNQLWDILNGNAVLRAGGGEFGAETTLVNGQRVINISGYQSGMSIEDQMLLGLLLGHEAYRDGIVTANNYLETRTAVQAHTEMAMRMMMGGYNIINDNLMMDMFALSMGEAFFNFYSDNFYDSSGDYWKLVKNENGEWNWVDDQSPDYDITDFLANRQSGMGGMDKLISQVLLASMFSDYKDFGVISAGRMTPELATALAYAVIPIGYQAGQTRGGLYFPTLYEQQTDLARSMLQQDTLSKWEQAVDIRAAAKDGLIFINPIKELFLTSPFGFRDDADPKKHDGIDYRAPPLRPIFAAESGVITIADLSYYGSDSKSSYLIIDHRNEWESRYVHMDSFTVKPGQAVTKGQLIGYSGTRGTDKAHLHFEIRWRKDPINPENFYGILPR